MGNDAVKLFSLWVFPLENGALTQIKTIKKQKKQKTKTYCITFPAGVRTEA